MKTLAVICVALAAGANAFIVPHGATHQKSALSHPWKPALSHPTWHKTTPSTSLEAMRSVEQYTEETLQQDTIPRHTGLLGLFGLLLFGTASYFMQVFLNQGCLGDPSTCTTDYYNFAEFFQADAHFVESFLLILTHAIPFVLIPVTMRLVSDQAPVIKQENPNFNPFIMQLGLATIGFGLALEFGWHVTSSWYYVNNFHILNFGFYFFLISGFALWADGFNSNARMDTFFGLILLAATIMYPLGNYKDAFPDATLPGFLNDLLEDPNSAKIPLYAGMTLTFGSITLRGEKLFGKQMYIVFLLSMVVNLYFIFQLQGLPAIEGCTEPDHCLTVDNYIYHVCHDLLGTEAGVAYFAYLVANYKPPLSYPVKK